jgi:hypothetical protein
MALKFFSPTNAPFYQTYKILKSTVKISHVCSWVSHKLHGTQYTAKLEIIFTTTPLNK